MVATSTLDLGVDWGDVDLVINVGAPKGASRLIQRVGRANHRLDEPSRALLVPGNRFEVLECRAAIEAAAAGAHDTQYTRTGALDVLAQHVLGTACAGPFEPDALFREVALGRCPMPALHATRSSTASSISSRPAAMRCGPTSATPGCGPPATAGCGCPIRASRSSTA